jgi:hypothetical protein
VIVLRRRPAGVGEDANRGGQNGDGGVHRVLVGDPLVLGRMLIAAARTAAAFTVSSSSSCILLSQMAAMARGEASTKVYWYTRAAYVVDGDGTPKKNKNKTDADKGKGRRKLRERTEASS